MLELDIKKDDFNKLDIDKQVDFINDKLKFTSLTKICNVLDINRATIRKRFKKYGYILNQDTLTYEKLNPNSKPLNSVKKPSDNTIDVNIFKEDINCLKRQINTLKSEISEINKKINTENTINTKSTLPKPQIQVFNDEIVSRAYKLDKTVQQNFKAFCKSNSEYRVSDILSTILKEYLDTHS